jgi:hypothetical protein
MTDVSEYYMAAEIATTFNGLDIAVPPVEWAQLVRTDPDHLCTLLIEITAQKDLKKLRKTPRSPKKPRTPRTKFKGKPPLLRLVWVGQESGPALGEKRCVAVAPQASAGRGIANAAECGQSLNEWGQAGDNSSREQL